MKTKALKLFVLLGLCVILNSGMLVRTAEVYALPPEGAKRTVEVRLLQNEQYIATLLETFEAARNEIVMAFYLFKTNGYRTNYPDRIVEGLTRAVQRGVRVRVLLEKTNEKNSFIDQSNEETAERLRRGGIDVEFDRPSMRTHVKMIIVDREILFVGSHNLTNSGLKYNNEASLMVFSPDLAEEALVYVDGIERQ